MTIPARSWHTNGVADGSAVGGGIGVGEGAGVLTTPPALATVVAGAVTASVPTIALAGSLVGTLAAPAAEVISPAVSFKGRVGEAGIVGGKVSLVTTT
jgi:hypothetical protein